MLTPIRFFGSLLLLFQLLCLSLPSAALDDYSTDVDLQANPAEVEGGSTDTTTGAGSWGIASHVIEGLMSAVQALTEPQPSDFWEKAKENEQSLQVYVHRLLESAETHFKSPAFTDITHAMDDIVRTTTTFRNSIQDALDVHHVTVDMLATELEALFMGVVQDLQNIPPPTKTERSSHDKCDEMVNKILENIKLALISLLARYGIDEEVVVTYLDALRPHLCKLIATIAYINEQYPQLLPTLMFSVVGLLLPELWILKPFLSVFGFGPLGPVKGSFAAWMQRYFWGAAVKSGSWFAWLQAAGMGVIPKWTWMITKVPAGVVGGLLAKLIPYLRG